MRLDYRLLLILFFFLLPEVKGQEPRLVLLRSFPVPEQLAVSSDAGGNIVLSTSGGEIQKFSANGKLLHTYSPHSSGYLSILDARFTMQVRAFDENSQQIIYLDRFLNPAGSILLPPEQFSFISALAWSATGNTIWLYDASDMQLIRWQTGTRKIISTLKLNQFAGKRPFEVKMLFEHQHKLCLLGADKLLIFDQAGNFDREVPLPEWQSATFSGEDLLCLTNTNTIERIHLYSGKRSEISTPATSQSYRKIIAANGEFYLFTTKQADVYRLVP